MVGVESATDPKEDNGVREALPRNAGEVHARHAPFVWRSLSALGVREADLEDQLQEVFLIVHRRLGEFRGEAKLTTWLFSICLRVSSAYRRSARRRPAHTHEVPEQGAHAERPATPEEELHARQLRAVMERFLDELTPERRALFVLFEVEETPCGELAELLGVPVGTVYSRLHAVRQEFLRTLEAFHHGKKAP